MASENSELLVKQLLKKNAKLFWWVPEDKVENLPLESLVEAVLNYGTIEQVRELFDKIGLKKVASIFREQVMRPRKVYSAQVENYFTLYFNKYAP